MLASLRRCVISAGRLAHTRLSTRSAAPQGPPWARIESIAGASSDTIYTDADGLTWRCIQWTASTPLGLDLATPGLLDALVVGGGSGSWSAYLGTGTRVFGSGGAVFSGLHPFLAGQHSVTIGAGGGDGVAGGASLLGSVLDTGVSYYGNPVGVISSITGVPIRYGNTQDGASAVANRGQGQGNAASGGGSSGFVAIRVPV